MKVKISDIAREAGVSTATVDRVINGSQSLGYARGSLAECETQILCSVRFGHLFEGDISTDLDLIQEVGRLVNGPIRSLSTPKAKKQQDSLQK